MSEHVPVSAQDSMTPEKQGTFFDPVGAANRVSGSTPPRPLPSALSYPTPQADLVNNDATMATGDMNKFGSMGTTEVRHFTPPTDEACHDAHSHVANDVVMSESTDAHEKQATVSDNIMQQIAAAARGPVSHDVAQGPVAQTPPSFGLISHGPVAGDTIVQAPPAQGPAAAGAHFQAGPQLEKTPEVQTSYGSPGPSTSYGSPGPNTVLSSIEAPFGQDASFGDAAKGTPEREAAFKTVFEDTPGTEDTPGLEETHALEETPALDESMEDSVAEASTNPDGSLRPGHFRCRFDDHNPCKTGQTNMKLARKTISDHFGRNKAQTRAIKSWPLFCRKHYQRATYKTDQWQLRKCVLILEQLETIEAQHPGTRYTIILKKSEATRLNGFLMAMANGTPVDQARAQFAPNETNRKTYEAPLHVLGELGRYLGKDKPRQDVEMIVALVRNMLKDKDCKQFPAIEFLPQLPIARTAPSEAPTEQA